MATSVANLVVEISASAQKLRGDLASAERSIGQFSRQSITTLAKVGTGFALAGAAIAGAVGKLVFDTAKDIDALSDSAANLGIATNELLKLQFQAEQAGSSAGEVGQQLAFMQSAIANAGQGSEPLIKAFQRLGTSAKELRNLSPEKQFAQIADGFSKISNQAEALDLAKSIFGRGGVSALNLLRSNLKETGDEFQRLGLGLTQQQLDNVDAFDKATNAVSAIWSSYKQQVAADAVPAFTTVSNLIQDMIKNMGGLGVVSAKTATALIGSAEGIVEAFDFVRKMITGLSLASQALQILVVAGTNKIASAVAALDPRISAEAAEAASREAELALQDMRNAFVKAGVEASNANEAIETIKATLAESGAAAQRYSDELAKNPIEASGTNASLKETRSTILDSKDAVTDLNTKVDDTKDKVDEVNNGWKSLNSTIQRTPNRPAIGSINSDGEVVSELANPNDRVTRAKSLSQEFADDRARMAERIAAFQAQTTEIEGSEEAVAGLNSTMDKTKEKIDALAQGWRDFRQMLEDNRDPSLSNLTPKGEIWDSSGRRMTLDPSSPRAAPFGEIWNSSNSARIGTGGEVINSPLVQEPIMLNIMLNANSQFFDMQAGLADKAVAARLNITSSIDPGSRLGPLK